MPRRGVPHRGGARRRRIHGVGKGGRHAVRTCRMGHRRPMLAMCGQEFLPAALCAPLSRPCPRCHEVTDTRRATVTTSDRSSRSAEPHPSCSTAESCAATTTPPPGSSRTSSAATAETRSGRRCRAVAARRTANEANTEGRRPGGVSDKDGLAARELIHPPIPLGQERTATRSGHPLVSVRRYAKHKGKLNGHHMRGHL